MTFIPGSATPAQTAEAIQAGSHNSYTYQSVTVYTQVASGEKRYPTGRDPHVLSPGFQTF